VDGSGYLDAEEVLAWMKSLEEEHDKIRALFSAEQFEKIKAVFDKLDKDNNGVADGVYGEKEVEAAFGMTDLNGDGVVSREECYEIWGKMIGMTNEQVDKSFDFCDKNGRKASCAP